MVVLAVEVDQSVAGRGELSERRGTPIDPGTAPALCVERASEDERTVVAEILACEPGTRGVGVGQIKLGGELRSIAAGTQLASLEPAAQQQRERVEQDGFPGARLAGQDREAGLELDVERLDDREIADR